MCPFSSHSLRVAAKAVDGPFTPAAEAPDCRRNVVNKENAP